LWASGDCRACTAFHSAPERHPHVRRLLLGLGGSHCSRRAFAEGPHLATYAWRGRCSCRVDPFIRSHDPAAGLVISAMASFMIAALGTPENQVERDHHRRSLPDGILQLFVSILRWGLLCSLSRNS